MRAWAICKSIRRNSHIGTSQTAGPNWQVATRYEFLRQEHIIRANMAEPLLRQIPRALAWAFDYLVSGAIFRVLRASWEFGLALIYFQMLLIWLARARGWRRSARSLGGHELFRLARARRGSLPARLPRSRSSSRCGRSPTAGS